MMDNTTFVFVVINKLCSEVKSGISEVTQVLKFIEYPGINVNVYTFTHRISTSR